jgi:hypothetical protein
VGVPVWVKVSVEDAVAEGVGVDDMVLVKVNDAVWVEVGLFVLVEVGVEE